MGRVLHNCSRRIYGCKQERRRGFDERWCCRGVRAHCVQVGAAGHVTVKWICVNGDLRVRVSPHPAVPHIPWAPARDPWDQHSPTPEMR